MATFTINSTTFSTVTRIDWQDDQASPGLDGNTPLLRWRRVIAQAAEVMTAANFNSLYAFEGQRVNITVPPYDDRNNATWKTYRGAICERVSGSHQGNVFVSVTAEFVVRL